MTTLLETKLHIPRLRRGVVARARLAAHRSAGELPALTLISAPAGFGKTTAAIEMFGAESPAWVSLDAGDNDPAVFWSYVGAALESVEPGLGSGVADLVRTPLQSSQPVVATLINNIDAVDREVLLVVDDYHVIGAAEIHAGVTFLLAHRPPRFHLVLVTRADPPLPLAALRVGGDLLEIRATDLRFTEAETAAYFNDAMQLGLASAQVEQLAARTEGWVAALQLAALSIEGRDDAAGFVASFAGDDRFVLDYLVGEVLDRQAPDVRTFLLETSVLSRLTGALCDAVTGRSDSRFVLNELERANLFLVPLDARRESYRYHHLFAEMLRARLIEERPTALRNLHRRAATWFQEQDDIPEAIGHALASDPAMAAELIERVAPEMRRGRQEVLLRGWLETLPTDLFVERPVLAVALAGARMGTGDPTGVAELLQIAEVSSAAAPIVVDRDEFARLPAQLEIYRAGLALLDGDVEATVVHATRALELAADDEHLQRGAASALVGLAVWGSGDLAEAQARYVDAIDNLIAAGHLADVLGCSVALADMQIASGRLSDATRTYERGLRVTADNPGLRGSVDMHVGLAEVFLERNRLAEAEREIKLARSLGDAAGLPQSPYRLCVVEARLLRAVGDVVGALRLLDDAERLYNTDFSPPLRPVSALKARMQLEIGDLEGAQSWARTTGVTVDDAPSYLHEFEQLTLGRVLLAQSNAGDAGAATEGVRLLERVYTAADGGGRDANAIEALALLARARHLLGDRAAAQETIELALVRAAPEQQVRTFMKSDIKPLVEAVRGSGPAAAFAREVLAHGAAPPPTRATWPALVDGISERESDVLRLLRSELSGPDIARELHVSLNTFRTHTKNIYAKLGVNNRREAIRRAAELGL